MTASVPYEILTLTYAKHVKRVFFCTILCLRVSLCKFFFPSEFFSVGNYVGSIYYVVPRHFDNLSDYFLIPSSLFLSLSLSAIMLNCNYLIKCNERQNPVLKNERQTLSALKQYWNADQPLISLDIFPLIWRPVTSL